MEDQKRIEFLMPRARTLMLQSLGSGLDYLDAAYYVTATHPSPLQIRGEMPGCFVEVRNGIFHRLVEEFRSAPVEVGK